MGGQRIEKAEWRDFFDYLSRCAIGMLAGIEGGPVRAEAEWLPLLGIVYDPKDDVLKLALEGADHTIRSMREVWVDAEAGELLSFGIIHSEGALQIIQLRAPRIRPDALD